MRHSYIDRPRRIRAPRASAKARGRFLSAVVALPVVSVLWVTVGLPVLSQVSGAEGGSRLSRSVVFGAQAAGSNGGSGTGSSAPQTVAAAVVSDKVLEAYDAEVAKRAQARARSRAAGTPATKLGLPKLPFPSAAPGTATFATADQPHGPAGAHADTTPPAKDTSPGPRRGQLGRCR